MEPKKKTLHIALKHSVTPDFLRRRPSWCRGLSTSSLDRLTSYSANIMLFSTSPRISSAAAYSRWWTNDLSRNIVASMSLHTVSGHKHQRQRLEGNQINSANPPPTCQVPKTVTCQQTQRYIRFETFTIKVSPQSGSQ